MVHRREFLQTVGCGIGTAGALGGVVRRGPGSRSQSDDCDRDAQRPAQGERHGVRFRERGGVPGF